MSEQWKELPFEDAIQKIPKSSKIPRKQFLDAGEYPIISQERDFINGYWNHRDDVFTVESPVVVFGDHTQVVKYIDFDFVIGADGVKVLRPIAAIAPKYFYYFLLANPLEELGYARHYRLLKELQVRFPESLAEQKRIVEVLDQSFEAIEKAKENAERNLANSRELFDSKVMHLVGERSSKWEVKSLLELCAVFVDSAHRTPKYQEEGFPALRPRDVVNGVLRLDGAKRVAKSEYDIQCKRHVPLGGDIVYSRELSFGWAALLPNEPKVCLSQGMCLFRPNDKIDTSYLLALLNGPVVRTQAKEAAVGTAHPHINLGPIKKYKIPLPPRGEQKEIIEVFASYSQSSIRLEHIYRQKLQNLDELKQSILQKAFTGKLTANPSEVELVG